MIAGALVLAASLSQSAPADTVRVHFSTPNPKLHAKLWQKRGEADSDYAFVCASPCHAALPGGAQLRATLDDHEDEPYDFVLSNEAGRDIKIIARRGGRGALAGGIVMTGIGGLTALVGVMLTALSFVATDSQRAEIRTTGLVCIGIGAGLTVGGVAFITGRTYEPAVKQAPVENKGWAEVPLPSVATPFSLTVTF